MIPGILALLFFLMPFLDRKLERQSVADALFRCWRWRIVLVGMIFLGFKSHLDDSRDRNVAAQLAFQDKQDEGLY